MIKSLINNPAYLKFKTIRFRPMRSSKVDMIPHDTLDYQGEMSMRFKSEMITFELKNKTTFLPQNINNAVFIQRAKKGVSKTNKLSPLRNSQVTIESQSPLSVSRNFKFPLNKRESQKKSQFQVSQQFSSTQDFSMNKAKFQNPSNQ